MNMTKHRGIALVLGIGVFLAAFGVALGFTVFQVSRDVPSTLNRRWSSAATTWPCGMTRGRPSP